MSLADSNHELYRANFVLADETVVYGKVGLTLDNVDLWVWPEEITSIPSAVAIFNDPNKTSKITMNYSQYQHADYDGYTRLMNIQTDSSGKLSIRLNRPANYETVSQE